MGAGRKLYIILNNYVGMQENVGIGTWLKMNVHNEPLGNLTMDDYDFEVEAYTLTGRGSVVIKKSDAIRVDENNYAVIVDTSRVGIGPLWMATTSYIPDGDVPGRIRPDVTIALTKVNIIGKR